MSYFLGVDWPHKIMFKYRCFIATIQWLCQYSTKWAKNYFFSFFTLPLVPLSICYWWKLNVSYLFLHFQSLKALGIDLDAGNSQIGGRAGLFSVRQESGNELISRSLGKARDGFRQWWHLSMGCVVAKREWQGVGDSGWETRWSGNWKRWWRFWD